MEHSEPAAIEVPHDALEPATLRRVIEEFVTRDSTDYGASERTLDEKVDDVLRQLRRGEAVVVFDPATSSVNILAKPARNPRRGPSSAAL